MKIDRRILSREDANAFLNLYDVIRLHDAETERQMDRRSRRITRLYHALSECSGSEEAGLLEHIEDSKAEMLDYKQERLSEISEEVGTLEVMKACIIDLVDARYARSTGVEIPNAETRIIKVSQGKAMRTIKDEKYLRKLLGHRRLPGAKLTYKDAKGLPKVHRDRVLHVEYGPRTISVKNF